MSKAKNSENQWAIIVHGGAQAVNKKDAKRAEQEIKKALQAGIEVLDNKGTALNAVEQAIRSMEEGGLFNCGIGSEKNADEKIQMDASIMDGRTLSIGAVAAIEDVQHPISAARALLGEKPVLVVGADATAFAEKLGLKKKFKSQPQGHQKDTVGCVAIDVENNMACGLSTGGLKDSMPGRVGDSVMPGCGFYADNDSAALCLSGDGETIARLMLAARIMHKIEDHEPEEALSQSFAWLEKVNGEAGCILVTKDRRLAWYHNSKNFPVGFQKQNEKPVIFLKDKSSPYP